MDLVRVIRENLRTSLVVLAAYLIVLLVLAWLSLPRCLLADGSEELCRSWLSANPFWGSFYGNLMATVAGLVLGLPVALHISALEDAKRRADEREAEERRRSAELVQHEALKESQWQAEERRRQEECARDAQRREEERQGEERQRSTRLADDLTDRSAMLAFIATEIGELESLLKVTLPGLRGGVAIDLPLSTTAWTAFYRDLLPALVSTGDGGLLVAKLTDFYRLLDLAQASIHAVVEERRRLLVPSKLLARKAQTDLADSIEGMMSRAKEIVPLVEAQMIAWRDQAAELRRDLYPK